MVTDPFYGTRLNVLDPTSGVWQTSLALISKRHRSRPDVAVAGRDRRRRGDDAARLLGAREAREPRRRRPPSVATLGLAAFPLALDMRWFGLPEPHVARAGVPRAGRGRRAHRAAAARRRRAARRRGLRRDLAAHGVGGRHRASRRCSSACCSSLDVVVERVRDGCVGVAARGGATRRRGSCSRVVSAVVVLPKAGVVTSSSRSSAYQAAELAQAGRCTLAQGGWLVARPGAVPRRRLGARLRHAARPRRRRPRLPPRATVARSPSRGICLLPVALLLDPPRRDAAAAALALPHLAHRDPAALPAVRRRSRGGSPRVAARRVVARWAGAARRSRPSCAGRRRVRQRASRYADAVQHATAALTSPFRTSRAHGHPPHLGARAC